jgi:hypothetical protein
MSLKKIKTIVESKRVKMGEVVVNQPLPSYEIDEIDPFLLLHHWKHQFPGGQKQHELGVGPHPHRGFMPVTILFEGGLQHMDSLGNNSIVYAGGAQWIMSGSGLMHSERPEKRIAEHGGWLELIQLWINIPGKYKMSSPFYQALENDKIGVARFNDNKVIIRNFAESLKGPAGSARVFSKMLISSVEMKKDEFLTLEFEEGFNTCIYQLDGRVKVNDVESAGEMLILFDKEKREVIIHSMDDARFLVMSGEPIGERTVSSGPFVMNSEGEIKQAFLDYSNGKFGTLDEKL